MGGLANLPSSSLPSLSCTGASSSCSNISVCMLRRSPAEEAVVVLRLAELVETPLLSEGRGTPFASSPRASTLRRLDNNTWHFRVRHSTYVLVDS